MQKLKTKLRQLRYMLKNEVLTLSHLSLIGILVLFVWWTASAVNSMSRNWTLQQRLAERRIQKSKLEIEVETLRLEQEYLKSAEYQEYMARAKQNRMAPGETMVILPQNSETAKNKYKTPDETNKLRSNLEQWLNFLFG